MLCFVSQGRDSVYWRPRLTLSWSCQRTWPPCAMIRARTTTHSELNSLIMVLLSPQIHCELNNIDKTDLPWTKYTLSISVLWFHFLFLNLCVCVRACVRACDRSPTVLGELLPARGRYYWETVVTGCAAYRLGVAYETANRSSQLGQNSKSWCLQCTPTASRYAISQTYFMIKYQYLSISMCPSRVSSRLLPFSSALSIGCSITG